jgi:hypothetical protein
VNYREILFEKIMSMHHAMRAAATRKPVTAAAVPAQPSLPEAFPSSAAAPARPPEPKSPPPPLEGIDAAFAMGCYTGRGGCQSIDDEFPADAATAGWRASLNRPAPDYGPPIDVSENNIVRLWEEQERRRKMEQSS